jgi:cell division protein FtsA
VSALHYGIAPKMKPISPRRSALVAALDIGSSKVACLIARLRPHPPQQVLTRRSHAVEVVGFGHTVARGTKAGAVVDLAQAEEAIRVAVDAAERMASVEIDSVVLCISAGRLASELFTAEIDVAGSAVSEGDIARVLAVGSRQSLRAGRAVLHSLPVGYSIDSANGIRDPRGMLGSRFGVDMHVATTDIAAARNLMLAVERCHLAVEAMVATPYVAGLSVIADDEADLGAAVIDMGAGTTTLSVFLGGGFLHSEGFALGGHHVTMDIARGLNAGIADAERIKTLYGSVLVGGSDERDMITVPPISEPEREQAQFVSRATLVHIIKPRVEEILEMVRDRLAASSFAAERRGRVILTGGASQLTGLPELAARILGRPVRIGRPLGIAGLPEAAKGPAFAAAAGLLVYPQAAHLEHFETRGGRYLTRGTARGAAFGSLGAGGGYLARVGQWLRESF